MRAPVIEPEHLDRLRKLEAATLIRRVTEDGGTLSPAEWAKLEGYAGLGEEEEDGRVPLALKDQGAIADFWGCGKRTVSRLKGEGFPWLEPWDAEGWWLRKYEGRRKAPVWLQSGVARWRKESEVVEEEEPERVSGFSVGEGADWYVGEQLAAQRALTKAYTEQLHLACQEGRLDDIPPLNRRLAEAGRNLRALEKDAPRIEIEQGRAWPKGEVVEALTDVGTAMNAAMDRFALSVAPLCVGRSEAEIVGIIEGEINRLRQPWSRMEFYLEAQPDE